MKDNAERMKCVRQIVAKRKQQKEKRKESFFKVTIVTLACLLLYCISSFPKMYQSAAVAEHCGTIILIGGIGGYVLTAILTFIAATIITVICIKKQNKSEGEQK